MEITKSYPVNRIMHVRPTTEVSSKARELRRTYPGIEIRANNPEGYRRRLDPINCWDSGSLLTNQIGAYDRIDIFVKGDYSREVLEKYADRIGGVFSRKSDEQPIVDLLFRQTHESKKEDKHT